MLLQDCLELSRVSIRILTHNFLLELVKLDLALVHKFLGLCVVLLTLLKFFRDFFFSIKFLVLAHVDTKDPPRHNQQILKDSQC